MRQKPSRLNVSGALAVLSLSGAALGCASEETQSSPAPSATFTWTGGDFTVTASAVVDGCLDGAAEVVAIPGPTTTREFQNPLPFPGSDELPGEVSIKFVDPFTEVKATVTSPKQFELTWDPAPVNKDVDLGKLSESWQGCVGDFEFGSTWNAVETADGDVKFEGKAEFRVTKTNGDAGCPQFEGELPCAVVLDVIATRKK